MATTISSPRADETQSPVGFALNIISSQQKKPEALDGHIYTYEACRCRVCSSIAAPNENVIESCVERAVLKLRALTSLQRPQIEDKLKNWLRSRQLIKGTVSVLADSTFTVLFELFEETESCPRMFCELKRKQIKLVARHCRIDWSM